jgi:hypothetical protein
MAWIESHTVLLRHRKVLLLSADLNLPPVVIVGHLHVLWHAILEQQEDGDLRDWPDEMIAQAAAYTGDAKAFVLALQSRKWLDGKMVHDWLEYAGRYLQSKYRTANQSKLEKIYKKHQSVRKTVSSQTKDRLKSVHLTRPNQPDLTNITNLTEDPALASQPLMESVVNLWNQIPGVVKSKAVVGPIRKRLLSRINEHPDILWWTTYFDKIKDSEFLTGRSKTDFAATLDWVLGPKNMAKILNGNYDGRPHNGHTPQAARPPFPGPEDPIGRNLWRQAYGNPR